MTPRVRRLVGQAAVAEVRIVECDVVVQPGRAHAQLRRGQSRGIDAVPDGRSAFLQLRSVGRSVSVGGGQLLGGGQHCRGQLDAVAKGTLQRERVRKVAVAHDEDSARLNDRCICHGIFRTVLALHTKTARTPMFEKIDNQPFHAIRRRRQPPNGAVLTYLLLAHAFARAPRTHRTHGRLFSTRAREQPPRSNVNPCANVKHWRGREAGAA